MRRSLPAVVVLLVGCSGTPSAEPNAMPSSFDPQLERLVCDSHSFEEGSIVLARGECADLTIAYVWPALRSSGSMMSHIFTVPFRRATDGTLQRATFAVTRGDGSQSFEPATFLIASPVCRDSPLTVHRGPVGVPREHLVMAFLTRMDAVRSASVDGDRAQFASAFLSLAELFDLSALDTLAQWLAYSLMRDWPRVIHSAVIAPDGLEIRTAPAASTGRRATLTWGIVPVTGSSGLVTLDPGRRREYDF